MSVVVQQTKLLWVRLQLHDGSGKQLTINPVFMTQTFQAFLRVVLLLLDIITWVHSQHLLMQTMFSVALTTTSCGRITVFSVCSAKTASQITVICLSRTTKQNIKQADISSSMYFHKCPVLSLFFQRSCFFVLFFSLHYE